MKTDLSKAIEVKPGEDTILGFEVVNNSCLKWPNKTSLALVDQNNLKGFTFPDIQVATQLQPGNTFLVSLPIKVPEEAVGEVEIPMKFSHSKKGDIGEVIKVRFNVKA